MGFWKEAVTSTIRVGLSHFAPYYVTDFMTTKTKRTEATFELLHFVACNVGSATVL